MKHRIVIEFETPDGPKDFPFANFSVKFAEFKARKTVSDYLESFEELRRRAMAAQFKITSSTSESTIEIA